MIERDTKRTWQVVDALMAVTAMAFGALLVWYVLEIAQAKADLGKSRHEIASLRSVRKTYQEAIRRHDDVVVQYVKSHAPVEQAQTESDLLLEESIENQEILRVSAEYGPYWIRASRRSIFAEYQPVFEKLMQERGLSIEQISAVVDLLAERRESTRNVELVAMMHKEDGTLAQVRSAAAIEGNLRQEIGEEAFSDLRAFELDKPRSLLIEDLKTKFDLQGMNLNRTQVDAITEVLHNATLRPGSGSQAVDPVLAANLIEKRTDVFTDAERSILSKHLEEQAKKEEIWRRLGRDLGSASPAVEKK